MLSEFGIFSLMGKNLTESRRERPFSWHFGTMQSLPLSVLSHCTALVQSPRVAESPIRRGWYPMSLARRSSRHNS